MTTGLQDIDPSYRVTTDDELNRHYGEPLERSLTKELDHLTPEYQVYVEKSPFVVVSSVGDGGLDSSPRGDPAGFVRVHDEKTVLIPDRRGNNRLDSLRNLVHDPRISLLFLIPGIGETLRINGRASIVTEPALRESFAMNGKVPASVLEVTVDRVYFQCQKALARSKLWSADAQLKRADVPSAGQILQAITNDEFDGATYDRDYPSHMKKTMY